MLISHSHKFVFIHIYKTGGTTVTQSMLPHARLLDQAALRYPTRKIVTGINRILGIQNNGNRWVQGVRKHATASEIRDYLGHERFEEYLTFAFVRNPWDWMCSQYFYIRKWRPHFLHERVRKLTFAEFLAFQIETETSTQSQFITDQHDNVIVDRIGRLETLTDDLNSISNSLRLEVRTDFHMNRSNPLSSYKDLYNPADIELVRDYFSEDIRRFDYSF